MINPGIAAKIDDRRKSRGLHELSQRYVGVAISRVVAQQYDVVTGTGKLDGQMS